ncbi:MAG: DUF58 domain-containing protein [Aureliella sp.]
MTTSQKYFDPETLAKLSTLQLRAQVLIEGLLAGAHRSPLHGHSIEFAQHREYTFGDDVRSVDWKVYARTDKYYVKQFEDETSLACYMLLDQSESMQYQGADSALSKLQYGQLIACCLSYLVVRQQDAAGLATFSSGVDDWLPASSSPSTFGEMVRILEAGDSRKRTSIQEAVEQTVARLPRRSMIVLISDLLEEVDSVAAALRLAKFAGHDVMVIGILDRDELDFPFDSPSHFEGLESAGDVLTDPLLIGGAYREAMAQARRELKNSCGELNVDLFDIVTDVSLAKHLPEILASRR